MKPCKPEPLPLKTMDWGALIGYISQANYGLRLQSSSAQPPLETLYRIAEVLEVDGGAWLVREG